MPTVSRMQKHFASLALLALVLGGCSFKLQQSEVVNLCNTDGDCTAGVCREARCVAEQIEPMELALIVTPVEPGDDRPAWTSAPFSIDGPTTQNLQLPGWVEMRGQVRQDQQRVAAEVVFMRPGLPGQEEVVFTTNTLAEPLVDDAGEESDFRIWLEAGQAYDVEVRPSAAMDEDGNPWFRMLPPLHIRGQLSTPEATAGIRSTIWHGQFPYDDTLFEACVRGRTSGCQLQGSVIRMHGDTPEPEGGLQVRAVDPSGEVVSSTAETGPDGAFSLIVSPGVSEYVLRVSGGAERPLFPEIEADPALLSSDLRIRVPEARVLTYEGRIESSENNQVAATLEFVSRDVVDDESGLTGAFRATALADGGEFSVSLLPGTYQVTITPSDLDFAVATQTVTVLSGASDIVRGQTFQVMRRARLGGSLEVQDGHIQGANVEARVIDRDMRTRASESMTDETGQFALRLDVGAYDIFLRPPPGSGYAWVIAPDLVVGDVDTTLAAQYRVEAPVPLNGVVQAADGTAVDGVEIRAFARAGERFVEVGRTRADEGGQYELLIPARFMTSQ